MSQAIERMAARAADRAVARVAEEIGAALPGAEVAIEEDKVVTSGRALLRRWMQAPALRWLGGTLR